MYKTHPLKQLMDHADKNGLKGFLPQNLSDELLIRMILESDAAQQGMTNTTPSTTLLMAVMCLMNGKVFALGQNKQIIASEKLMECFDAYMISVGLEEMRRQKVIDMPKESLPTIKNIFDKSRLIEIVRL